MQPSQLLESFQWRYAVKKFDSTKKIPAETWNALEQSLVLAPSSFGLQPWKFFIVDDPATREKLLPHSWNQRQVVDADKLIVFAVKTPVGASDAERLVRRTAEIRNVPLQSLEAYKGMIVGSMASQSPEAVENWMIRQVYIAHGFFLAAAAALGVDACPMEGFTPGKYDEILGLPAQGYRSVVVATAGYRASDDKYATLAKVRYETNEVVAHI